MAGRLTIKDLAKTTLEVMAPRRATEVIQAGKDVGEYRARFPAHKNWPPETMSTEQYLAQVSGKKGSKLGNQRTRVAGREFDSKLEAKRFEQLMEYQRQGLVWLVLCQVPFFIAPGVRYKVDFAVFWTRKGPTDSGVVFEDVKGFMTDTSRVKIRTVEHLYQINISILTKKDIRP